MVYFGTMRSNRSIWLATTVAGMIVFSGCTSTGVQLGSEPWSESEACRVTQDDIQLLRDNLEIARTYLGIAKDNFGSSRNEALASTAAAIQKLEAAVHNPAFAPTPNLQKAYHLGGEKHPRMTTALLALELALKHAVKAESVLGEHAAGIRESIEDAIRKSHDAFNFRSPWGGGR